MAIALSQEELVQQWENFFRDYYKDRIEETALAWPEERSLVVDYKDIDLRDITLAEHVLENPVAAFVTAERALRQIDVPVEPRPRLRFRVTGLPESAHIPIRKLRAAHLGKLVAVQGLIKKVTEVRPKLEDAAFRCSLCGCVFRHPQQGEQVLEEPEVCPEERGGCGRNSRFKVISEQSAFIDHQKVEIQESPEALKGGSQPERLSVYVEDDLVGHLTPGNRVILNIVMRSQARRQGNLKLTEFAKVGDLVSVQHEQHDFDEVEIEPEDEERIIELAQNPHIYEVLRKSFSPTIFGLEREKDALILALFGGVGKSYPDGSRTRGDIHVLMIGDPGTGKCMRGDTRIPLATGGVTPIRDLVEEALRGERHEVDDGWWAPLRVPVLSMDARGRIVPKYTSRAWKRQAPENLLRVRTSTGREIDVTPTHPLFMTDGLLIHSRKASLLKTGDHIALPRRRPILLPYQDSSSQDRSVRRENGNALQAALQNYETIRGTDMDLVPVEPRFLQNLRQGLGLGENDMGVPSGTILGIERGEKHPTRATFSKITDHLESVASEIPGLDPKYREAVGRMVTLASSDVFWDRVESIESVEPEEGHVYDLEVPDTHNFLANGIVNHNSQLLRYMSKLAPRSIYTSGKSASAAGLCVAPDTLVTLSNGELVEIGPFTESRMAEPEKVEDGVWRQWTNGVGVETVDGGLKLKPRQLEAVWRLRSPKTLLEIEAQSGRRLTVSEATPLPVRDPEVGIRWVPAKQLGTGTHLATPRTLPEPPGEVPCILELLEDAQECTVGGTEELMRKIVSRLIEQYGSIREAARCLDVPEGSLYRNWVRGDVRGRPSLAVLLRLAERTRIDLEEVARSIAWYSKRRGHRISLPTSLNKDFLYLVGLIAADGSVFKQENGGVAIRFSSGNEDLMAEFVRRSRDLFAITPRVTRGSSKRPADARFHSRVLADVLNRLGVPRSPKSHRVDIPAVLQRLPNNHLAAYLRGLFDGDGSCNHHETGGSSVALYSTSLPLVRKLQVLLLRFGIQSNLRSRNHAGRTTPYKNGTIISRHDVQVLTITGSRNLIAFRDAIGFTHPAKRLKLDAITATPRAAHSNRDAVPDVGSGIRAVREVLGLSQTNLGVSRNLEAGVFQASREYLDQAVGRLQAAVETGDFPGTPLLIGGETRRSSMNAVRRTRTWNELAEALGTTPSRLKEWTTRSGRRTRIPAKVLLRLVSLLREQGHKELAGRVVKEADLVGYQAELAAVPLRLERLRELARSDVHWDPIVAVRPVPKSGDYIYDLTVDGTHNFVANGLLAHNTAAAVRDEFGEGQWTLEAGALVLADQGIACVDELDKMSKEDQSAMHQAMEQQEISVAKAGIQATLRSRCAVIGGANPKMGRFDSYAPIHEQINMPPALLSRFDLIFSMKDEPHKEMDEKLASYILRNHRAGQVAMHREHRPDGQYSAEEERFLFEKITPELVPEFLRKYVAYAKRNIFPVLDDDAITLIKDYYVDLRNAQAEGIAFTARQLEAFVRLSEASARVRLSEVATMDDAKRAIGIVEYYLKGVGMDPESGTFDIDMIVTGTSHTQRDRMTTMIQIIRDLGKDSKHKVADREQILERAAAEGIEAEKADAALQQLKAKGQVYEPRAGNYRLT